MKCRASLLLLILAASCSPPSEPDVGADKAWSRPTAAREQAAVVYLNIVNRGAASDRLLSVHTGDGARASLHESSMEGGVMRMRSLDGGLDVAPHSTVELKPNGTHIMLEGLRAPLRAGTSFLITLRFEKSPEQQVQVQVGEANASSHAHGTKL
ncbi:MAG: copper chaperone PCu(A)C [Sphingomicrobium sp.]